MRLTGSIGCLTLLIMLVQIAIKRDARDGERGEILDVAEFLKQHHGSAINALAFMVRESKTFKDGQRRLLKKRRLKKSRANG